MAETHWLVRKAQRGGTAGAIANEQCPPGRVVLQAHTDITGDKVVFEIGEPLTWAVPSSEPTVIGDLGPMYVFTAEPEAPAVAEPEAPAVAEPEAPAVAEPEAPAVAEPEAPAVAEPDVPADNACPTCGASGIDPCLTSGGNPRQSSHRSRL